MAMRTIIVTVVVPMLVLQETSVQHTRARPEVAPSIQMSQPPGDDITGFWKLKLEAYDNNGNKILDDDERKQGIKNNYSFRFNTDGSCKIVEAYKGRYEVKTESNKKMLYVYRNKIEGQEKKDPPPDIYHIISMNKNELVLLEDEGDLTFWVFERLAS
jgi:hypothetical protein